MVTDVINFAEVVLIQISQLRKFKRSWMAQKVELEQEKAPAFQCYHNRKCLGINEYCSNHKKFPKMHSHFWRINTTPFHIFEVLFNSYQVGTSSWAPTRSNLLFKNWGQKVVRLPAIPSVQEEKLFDPLSCNRASLASLSQLLPRYRVVLGKETGQGTNPVRFIPFRHLSITPSSKNNSGSSCFWKILQHTPEKCLMEELFLPAVKSKWQKTWVFGELRKALQRMWSVPGRCRYCTLESIFLDASFSKTAKLRHIKVCQKLHLTAYSAAQNEGVLSSSKVNSAEATTVAWVVWGTWGSQTKLEKQREPVHAHTWGAKQDTAGTGMNRMGSRTANHCWKGN